MRVTYERADDLLSESRIFEVLNRLRRAAARLFATSGRREQVGADRHSIATSNENKNHTWENFSLKEEVRRLEERYIRLALKDSEGRVSHAAKLLGFDDHGSLNSLLKNKYPHLRAARLPASPRKRSIVRR